MRPFATVLLASVACANILVAQTPEPEQPSRGIVEFSPSSGEILSSEDAPTGSDRSQALDVCKRHLTRIGEAIRAYRSEHQGRNPVWLSDLYPDYLSDADAFLCPSDSQRGDSGFGSDADPHLSTSYAYEFTPSRFDSASSHYRTFGSIAPLVRCWHHLDVPLASGQGETVLTLDHAGNVDALAPEWETDSHLIERLFETIRGGIVSGDSAMLVGIRFGALDLLNDDMRAQIATMLESRKGETENAGAQKLLAAFARRAGRTNDAIAAYENAARLLPDEPEVHFLLGVLYQQSGRRADARNAYEQGLRLQPDTVDVLRELATFYADDGNSARVQELYELLKTIFRPESFGHRLVMGDVAYLADDIRTALDSYQWLLERYPKGTPLDDPTLRHIVSRVAELYDRTGKTTQAEQLRIAIEPGRALMTKPAPPITGVDAQGNAVTLTFGSKPTALVFWGSWGSSCDAQLATMRKVQERFGTDDLTVVGVNAAETVEPEILFASVHASFRQVYDAGTGFLAYRVRVIPTTVFVDRNGIVQDFEAGYRLHPDEALFERVQRLIAIPSTPETSRPLAPEVP
jgi:thiol-disulfide isomerase/thioredoxin